MPSPRNAELEPEPLVREVLQKRAAQVESLVPQDRRKLLLNRALEARTVGQRVHWLRVEADQVSAAASDVSPCRKGCSHCCHIAVLVSRAEAEHIGRAIGRPPRQLAASRGDPVVQGFEDVDGRVYKGMASRHFGVACPFLQGDDCGIYRDRPLACRWLISLADTAEPCRLNFGGGEQPVVPYLDRVSANVASVMALGVNGDFADLRDWFPADG